MSLPCTASRRIAISLTAVVMSTVSLFATASTSKTFPDAEASDPAKLGWMVGSPPPADRTVRFEDGS
jgi:hypothetical protein